MGDARPGPAADRVASLLLRQPDAALVATLWPAASRGSDRVPVLLDWTGLGPARLRSVCESLIATGLVTEDGQRSEACERWLRAEVVAHEAKAVAAGAAARKVAGSGRVSADDGA